MARANPPPRMVGQRAKSLEGGFDEERRSVVLKIPDRTGDRFAVSNTRVKRLSVSERVRCRIEEVKHSQERVLVVDHWCRR